MNKQRTNNSWTTEKQRRDKAWIKEFVNDFKKYQARHSHAGGPLFEWRLFQV